MKVPESFFGLNCCRLYCGHGTRSKKPMALSRRDCRAPLPRISEGTHAAPATVRGERACRPGIGRGNRSRALRQRGATALPPWWGSPAVSLYPPSQRVRSDRTPDRMAAFAARRPCPHGRSTVRQGQAVYPPTPGPSASVGPAIHLVSGMRGPRHRETTCEGRAYRGGGSGQVTRVAPTGSPVRLRLVTWALNEIEIRSPSPK